MKNKFLLAGMLLVTFALTACAQTVSKPLISAAQKPADITFEVTDFEGNGKIEMPTGEKWEKNGTEYYNADMDMTIFTQSQSDIFPDQMKEYTDSYIEVNKRDAPKYEVVQTEEGEINSIKAVRVDGKFNNGTAYVTRDYLFFTGDKVLLLMARAEEKNAQTLNETIDYIASSVKK